MGHLTLVNENSIARLSIESSLDMLQHSPSIVSEDQDSTQFMGGFTPMHKRGRLLVIGGRSLLQHITTGHVQVEQFF